MSHKKLMWMEEQLIAEAEKQFECLEEVCTKELGEVIDMIKDLKEAIYYETVTKAMEAGDSYKTEKSDCPHVVEHGDSRSEYEGKSSHSRQLYIEARHMNKDKAMQMLKAKLYMLKQEANAEKLSDIRGTVTEIGWGNQIRSYVMQPYTMVKDHRTGVESGNVDAVMDGSIDLFINGYLKWLSLGCPQNMDSDEV